MKVPETKLGTLCVCSFQLHTLSAISGKLRLNMISFSWQKENSRKFCHSAVWSLLPGVIIKGSTIKSNNKHVNRFYHATYPSIEIYTAILCRKSVVLLLSLNILIQPQKLNTAQVQVKHLEVHNPPCV